LKNQDGQTALILSVQQKSISLMNFLLAKKVAVNLVDTRNRTALWHACDQSWFVGAKSLLEYGVKLNVADKSGFTPLARAAYRGNEKLIKILLKNKANAAFKTNSGNTIMMLSVLASCTQCVQQLLDIGVEVDRQNDNGDTALLLAMRKGNVEITALLFQYEANPMLRNYQKQNAISLARKSQNSELIHLVDEFSLTKMWLKKF
jgi:ankyrin repeat protein